MRADGWVRTALLASWLMVAGASVSAAPEEDLEARLAAATAADRASAARTLGDAYEHGAPLAHVLTVVALEDEDATVRAAAAHAVETLAVTAAERWRSWLGTVRLDAETHPHFGPVAEEQLRTSHQARTSQLAMYVAGAPDDAARADMLAVALLAMRHVDREPLDDAVGLDTLLATEAAKPGPLASAAARDALVVLACRRLRLGTEGAPGPAPSRTRDVASWTALIDGSNTLSESALVVLGCAARPGEGLLQLMARYRLLAPVGIQGRAAVAVQRTLRDDTAPAELLPWARRRVGILSDVLPVADAAALEAGYVYARMCDHLSELDPLLAGPALPTLMEHVQSKDDHLRLAALVPLSRLPELPAEARTVLEGIAEERGRGLAFRDTVASSGASLARLALVQGTDGRKTLDDLMAALLDTADLRGRSRGNGASFRREVKRRLGSLAQRLTPALEGLHAMLDNRALPLEVRTGIIQALVRMPGANASTVQRIKRLVATPADPAAEDMAASRATAGAEVDVGSKVGQAVEMRRTVASALRTLGPLAAEARAELEHILRDPDAIVRWHARRASHAIAAK